MVIHHGSRLTDNSTLSRGHIPQEVGTVGVPVPVITTVDAVNAVLSEERLGLPFSLKLDGLFD